MNRLNVGILLFENVEVLDFAGPYEVFSRTRTEPGAASRRSEESAPFRVFTVARSADELKATGGLRVIPDFSFADCPPTDVIVVPGGFGTRALLQIEDVLGWIRSRAAEAGTRVTSVCTGSLLLAGAGLLAGRRATTHWSALETLAELDSSIQVERELRVVDDGIVTSAGVSAGIDMALQIVQSVCGSSVADETARYIEYRRAGD